nr:uncharacterized protein LOC109150426 [Ipomoea trifida]
MRKKVIKGNLFLIELARQNHDNQSSIDLGWGLDPLRENRWEEDIQVSCGEILKVQPKTIVHTRVQAAKEGNVDLSCEVKSSQDEYIDVFAWTYKEMPGLAPKVAVHRLAVKKACRLVKQAQRRFRPELIPLIEGEVNKLIEDGFIREVKYPTWISSIVHVRKKNGQIRVCVNFRDLNVACSKDDFPLPITELMIDAVTGTRSCHSWMAHLVTIIFAWRRKMRS